MKNIARLSLICYTLLLAACSEGMPQLFWPVEGNKPDYARGAKSAQAKGRPPLEVPPELRKEVEVPMPDEVAVNAARGDVKMSPEEKAAVAGKAVSLDTRLYDKPAAEVFSAVLDAMTALNLPVDSVDSPSGTVTTEWVRPNANTPNVYVGTLLNVFGAGPVHLRFRHIVRVFRTKDGKTELQVRTLGQQFINRHWVNKPLKRQAANELFSAIEERLGNPPKNAVPARIKPESSAAQ